MNIRFMRRDLAGPVYIPGLAFEVERMAWSIRGGCSSAEVLVRGPLERLGLLAQLLRCGATISDETGAAAWWGFVNGVELFQESGRVLSASLDDLYNRIAIRYRDERISPEVNTGWQWQSFWAQDDNSVREWGRKEGIFTQVPASPDEVRSLRAALLEKLKRPTLKATSPTPPPGVGAGPSPTPLRGREARGEGVARLKLRGWWDTLNWQYFNEPRGYAGHSGGGAIQSFGNLAAFSQVAGSFQVYPGWTAQTLWGKVGKYGAPGDNLYMALAEDAGGSPGTWLGGGSVAGSALNGEVAWTRFDFTAAYPLAENTTYWVVFCRSGALDPLNYYRVSLDDGLGYAGGAVKIFNGGAWLARVPDADLVFQLTGQALTTTQIQTMADPAGAGQFLKGVFVVNAAGVSARLYRDGSKRAGDEIQELLDQGTAAGARLQAAVTAERWLIVKSLPPAPEGPGAGPAAELVLLPSGELRSRVGLRLPCSLNPVGKWARIAGLSQPGGDRNVPGCVLVSQAEWVKGRLGVAWEG